MLQAIGAGGARPAGGVPRAPAHRQDAARDRRRCRPTSCLVDPQPYLEFNYLVQHAKAVITDSGGVTEETTVMGVPCMTLRNTTERPETVSIGTNELIGTDPSRLAPALDRLFEGRWKRGGIPPLWDGKTSERIAERLEVLLDAGMASAVNRVA